MRLLLATSHLNLGGSESYLLILAEQLDRLGHEVVVFAPEPGGRADVAEEREIEVASRLEILDGEFDAAVVQDAAVSLEVAAALPEAPQVFVAHSEIFNLQTPPQPPGLLAGVVALSSSGSRPAGTATQQHPARRPAGLDRGRVRAGGAGVGCVGGGDRSTTDPVAALHRADIVIG